MTATHHKGALFVFAAALIYAAFGSPTPDTLGIAEIFTLFFLLAGVTCIRCITRTQWTLPFTALLIYGASVPLIIGTLDAHTSGDILRDLIAFMVLAVPVVFASFYPSHDSRAQNYLLLMLLSIGMIFALRYLIASADMFASFGISAINGDLLYLANSPLVAFAAAWLLLQGCFGEDRPGYAICFVLLSLIPIAAMVGMMQRATLGLLALAWAMLFIRALIVNPSRALNVALGIAMAAFILWPLPQLALQSLADKTWAVGWNARGAEFNALLDALQSNFITTLFGTGWGSMIKSPAVGELWVRFSHAFITSMLWKTGWVGLILSIAAIGALLVARLVRLRHNLVISVSLILAVIPSLFLYGSYKSLCFGFLLLGLGCLNWTKQTPKC